jgi:catechol 2,3-dioxygenase-like lactoylglutathione lyase family enzyme
MKYLRRKVAVFSCKSLKKMSTLRRRYFLIFCSPNSRKINSLLHHIEIYVSDLERSVAFWTPFMAMLGYEAERWLGGMNYVKEGDSYFCFLPAPKEHLAAGYHRKRVGLNHLAFAAKGSGGAEYALETNLHKDLRRRLANFRENSHVSHPICAAGMALRYAAALGYGLEFAL